MKIFNTINNRKRYVNVTFHTEDKYVINPHLHQFIILYKASFGPKHVAGR